MNLLEPLRRLMRKPTEQELKGRERRALMEARAIQLRIDAAAAKIHAHRARGRRA